MPTMVKIPAPWSVQIEMTRNCNRRCSFCGVATLGWKVGEYEFLGLESAVSMARGIAVLTDHPRIEFALRGEPLLNPEAVPIVKIFRSVLPRAQLYISTNGTRLRANDGRELVASLFQGGLNILCVNLYKPDEESLYELVHGWRLPVAEHNIYQDAFSPWHNHGPEGRHIVYLPDLSSHQGEKASRTIFNHAGNSLGGPVPAPLKKRCTLPFRELAIHVDGTIPLCCMDFRRRLVVGAASDIPGAWGGPIMEAARKMLFHRLRLFAPCCACDAGNGTRSGLIRKMPYPEQADVEMVGGHPPCESA